MSNYNTLTNNINNLDQTDLFLDDRLTFDVSGIEILTLVGKREALLSQMDNDTYTCTLRQWPAYPGFQRGRYGYSAFIASSMNMSSPWMLYVLMN